MKRFFYICFVFAVFSMTIPYHSALFSMQKEIIPTNEFVDMPAGVTTYINSLAKIKEPIDGTDDAIVDSILSYLKECSPSSGAIVGEEHIKKKIKTCVQAKQPIQGILVAFPCKSGNTENKVIGSQVDMGEFVGLMTINHIFHQISTIYKPGATMTIYTRADPFLYDINKICQKEADRPMFSEDSLETYQQQIKKLITSFPYLRYGDIPCIRDIYQQHYASDERNVIAEDIIHNYTIFMKEEMNSSSWKEAIEKTCYNRKRNEFIEAFSSGNKVSKTFYTLLKNGSWQDVKKNSYYGRVIKQKLGINNTINTIADQCAECAARGAARVRCLLQREIPNFNSYVRFSIHGDQDISKKFGIAMIMGSEGTPWHKSPVIEDNSITLMSRKQAKKCNGSLCHYQWQDFDLGYINKK